MNYDDLEQSTQIAHPYEFYREAGAWISVYGIAGINPS